MSDQSHSQRTALESVARALCRHEGVPDHLVNAAGQPAWTEMLESAHVAIGAMQEPTSAMLAAAGSAAQKAGGGDYAAIWRAMIEAALAEPVQPVGRDL